MTTINVVFQGTFITDPTDTTSVQVSKVDRSEHDNKAGSVRIYAGGRRRIITGPGVDRSSALTLNRVTAAELKTLLGWRGRTLLLRDFQDWRRFGTFLDLQWTSVFQGPTASPLFTVALTWSDSDYSEAV